MPGDLTARSALHHVLDHRTILLHGQHLLLHLHGLHHSRLPQPAQGIPLLEETPHLQGPLRQGDQALAPGRLWSMPFSRCLHPAVANISLWTSERMLCSWKSLFFLLPESPEMMLSSLCPTAGGSSLQLSLPAGHSLTAATLCVSGGSPRLPSDLHIPFPGGPGDPSPPAHPVRPLLLPRGLSVHFRMHRMPPHAFWCILGAPVCISGDTVFLCVPFSAPQEPPFALQCSPGASACLSVCPKVLLGPFGAPSTPHLPFSDPSRPSMPFCALKTP